VIKMMRYAKPKCAFESHNIVFNALERYGGIEVTLRSGEINLGSLVYLAKCFKVPLAQIQVIQMSKLLLRVDNIKFEEESK
jgi:hypothetical protein